MALERRVLFLILYVKYNYRLNFFCPRVFAKVYFNLRFFEKEKINKYKTKDENE